MSRGVLAEADRRPDEFRIAKGVYIAVDDDAERARPRVTTALERIYGRRGFESAAVFGPPDVCARALREVAAAGADMIQFTPLFDQAEQMERLAAEVMPSVS